MGERGRGDAMDGRQDGLSLDDQLWIDKVCLQFEESLRAGSKPLIETILDSQSLRLRTHLLRHLLSVEQEFRQLTPSPLFLAEALARFPEDGSTVNQVFQERNDRGDAVSQSEAAVRVSDSSSSLHGRFEPGQLLAGRYRIVSRLGTGGMGEVYRADDLVLAQHVALKFLPDDQFNSPKRMEYFFREVRLARQVTHPHVCRVHDIGEAEATRFISMEFIDGENLKTLLRRIGHLPFDKAVEIAHQLCSGLAAAHASGVLHRDLKPANVMIDGQGQVRITDFGLARVVDEKPRADSSGTPAYMAPEQREYGQTSIQSDLYSLGLVLHELFTGQSAESALQSGVRPDRESQYAQMSVNPSIRNMIAKCLHPQPDHRPRNAHELIRLLPIADPIEAARSLGQVPSPEAVASTGGFGSMSHRAAGVLLAVIVVALTVVMLLNGSMPATYPKEPAALREVAESILSHAELPIRPLGKTAHGFRVDEDLQERSSDDRQASEYWYRSGPEPLIPNGTVSVGRGHAPVRTLYNPPPLREGMISLRLSSDGRQLRELMFIPGPTSGIDVKSEGIVAPKTWSNLFEDANLNVSDFEQVPTAHVPPFPSLPHTWITSQSSESGEQLRVEAASIGTHVVYFQVFRPSGKGPTTPTSTLDRSDGATTWGWMALPYGTLLGETREGTFVIGATWYCLLVLASCTTWRHVKNGACNGKGAARVAFVVFACCVIAGFLESDHLANLQYELAIVEHVISRSLIRALGIGILYAAVEPLMRAHLPRTLISWNRLLSGRLDSMVSRDALIGCAFAAVFSIAPAVGDGPFGFSSLVLMGTEKALAQIPSGLTWAMLVTLFVHSILLMFTMVSGRIWAGVLVAFLLIMAPVATQRVSYELMVGVLAMSCVVTLLINFGLVACLSFEWCVYILARFPITAEIDRWYAGLGGVGVASLVIFAVALSWRATSRADRSSHQYVLLPGSANQI